MTTTETLDDARANVAYFRRLDAIYGRHQSDEGTRRCARCGHSLSAYSPTDTCALCPR